MSEREHWQAVLKHHLEILAQEGQELLPVNHTELRKKEVQAVAQTTTGEHEAVEAITADLVGCKRCRLCEDRKHIVIGRGDPKADLMFVGEAPGRDEDRQGLPFVGRAGQLLDRIITAMGFSPQEIYIANVIKCRPPQNRNPEPDEVSTCLPFLLRQIAAVRPKVLCTLGTFAAHALLSTDERISLLRGRFRDFNGIPLMPTYHPAFLLRNPKMKKAVWEDVQQVSHLLGREPVQSGRAGEAS